MNYINARIYLFLLTIIVLIGSCSSIPKKITAEAAPDNAAPLALRETPVDIPADDISNTIDTADIVEDPPLLAVITPEIALPEIFFLQPENENLLEKEKEEQVKTKARLIKENHEMIEKAFSLDAGGNLVVTSVIEDETCLFDIANASMLDGAIKIPFNIGDETDYIFFKLDANNKSGILLGFDDEYYSQWENYFPLFKKYNANVTFFVQGNSGFCKKAVAAGHDIGYHTATHPDLRQLSRKQWLDEAVTSRAKLLDAGIKISSFAYPFGFSESWMDKTLLENNYKIVRGFGTTIRLYKSSEMTSGIISAKSIDNTIIQSDNEFYKTINTLLYASVFLGDVILPLTTHNINADDWAIRPDRLEYLLKTASELRLHFYRYCDLAQR